MSTPSRTPPGVRELKQDWELRNIKPLEGRTPPGVRELKPQCAYQ